MGRRVDTIRGAFFPPCGRFVRPRCSNEERKKWLNPITLSTLRSSEDHVPCSKIKNTGGRELGATQYHSIIFDEVKLHGKQGGGCGQE